MSEFNVQTYNERQAPLEAAKAAFFMSGNFIREIATGVGCESLQAAPGEPVQHKTPDKRPQAKANAKAKRDRLLERLRHLAVTEGYNHTSTAKFMGVSQHLAGRIAAENGIKFGKKSCAD